MPCVTYTVLQLFSKVCHVCMAHKNRHQFQGKVQTNSTKIYGALLTERHIVNAAERSFILVITFLLTLRFIYSQISKPMPSDVSQHRN